LWHGPRYQPGTTYDQMEFTCIECDFRYRVPALDERHQVDAIVEK